MGDVISTNLDEGKRELITGKTRLSYFLKGMKPFLVQYFKLICFIVNVHEHNNHSCLREPILTELCTPKKT